MTTSTPGSWPGWLGLALGGGVMLLPFAEAPADKRWQVLELALLISLGACLLGCLAGVVAWRTRERQRTASKAAVQAVTTIGSVVGIVAAASFAGDSNSAMIPGALLLLVAFMYFTMLYLRRAADAAAGQPPDPGREP